MARSHLSFKSKNSYSAVPFYAASSIHTPRILLQFQINGFHGFFTHLFHTKMLTDPSMNSQKILEQKSSDKNQQVDPFCDQRFGKVVQIQAEQ